MENEKKIENTIAVMTTLLGNKLAKSEEYQKISESFPELCKKIPDEYLERIKALAVAQAAEKKPEPNEMYHLFSQQNGFQMLKLLKQRRSSLKLHFPELPTDIYIRRYRDIEKDMKARLKMGEDKKKIRELVYGRAERIKKVILHDIANLFDYKWRLDMENAREKLIDQIVKEILQRISRFADLMMLIPDRKLAGQYWDLTKGNWQKGSMEKLLKWKEKFVSNKELRNIVNTIGRSKSFSSFNNEIMKVMKRSTKKNYENEFKEEMMGITEGNDISIMLPSELIYLSHERLRPLFYNKYAENKLSIYQFRNEVETEVMEEGVERKKIEEKKVQMGPVILCIDTSGSMQGMPEVIAKSLSLSVIMRALGEKRPVYLISFGTGIETTEFDPQKFSFDNLMDFMCMSFNQGTDPGPALKEAIRMTAEEKFKDADVVMVSDFIMPALPTQLPEKIIEVKKLGTRFLALAVTSNNNASGVPHFDNTWMLNTNRPGEIIELNKI